MADKVFGGVVDQVTTLSNLNTIKVETSFFILGVIYEVVFFFRVIALFEVVFII